MWDRMDSLKSFIFPRVKLTCSLSIAICVLPVFCLWTSLPKHSDNVLMLVSDRLILEILAGSFVHHISLQSFYSLTVFCSTMRRGLCITVFVLWCLSLMLKRNLFDWCWWWNFYSWENLFFVHSNLNPCNSSFLSYLCLC